MYPNNFTDGTLVGIVVGGDINDPAPDQSCNMKVFIPGMHGKDVKIEHLAFSTMMKAPTNTSQQSFEGTLDPGSIVFVRKDTGSNQCHIVGTGNEIVKYDSRVPGNIDLLAIPAIQKILNRTIDVRIPPTVKEEMIDGVLVRQIQEKNKFHSHSLLKGIPANGAIYPLSGMKLTQVTNVSTATQSFSSILSPIIAAALPGVSMSLGEILNNITGSTLDSLLSSIPRDLVDGFQTMSTLMQSIDSSGNPLSLSSKVHPETIINNSVELLSQCRNISDIVSAMQQLQYDKSLYGLDKLSANLIELDTPFGKLPTSVDASGNIISIIPNGAQQAIGKLSSMMSSPTSFPGINVGENLFGNSSKTVLDMFNRLPQAGLSTAINMATKLNTSHTAQIWDKGSKSVLSGGNPIANFFS